jgi:hypothetical protein
MWLNSATSLGIGDVGIHLLLASPGPVVAAINVNGWCETPFFHIPHDEMVTAWAEWSGYAFDPPREYPGHYRGVEHAVSDFGVHRMTLRVTSTLHRSTSTRFLGQPFHGCTYILSYQLYTFLPVFHVQTL